MKPDEFLTISYQTVSTGRIELWMEGTGVFDGLEIYTPSREPTEEDLVYAMRSEEGKIKYIRASAILNVLPEGLSQSVFRSSLYDEDIAGDALRAFKEVSSHINEAVRDKMNLTVGEGSITPKESDLSVSLWREISQP